MITDNDK